MKAGPHIKQRKKLEKNAMKVLTVMYLKTLKIGEWSDKE